MSLCVYLHKYVFQYMCICVYVYKLVRVCVYLLKCVFILIHIWVFMYLCIYTGFAENSYLCKKQMEYMGVELNLGKDFDRYETDFRMPDEEVVENVEEEKKVQSSRKRKDSSEANFGRCAKKRVNIVLPENLNKQLRVISSERGCSFSSIVEKALEKMVNDEIRKNPKLRAYLESL